MTSFPKIFVTVGTTEFDDLTSAVVQPDVLEFFARQFNCRRLLVQIGRGKYEPNGIKFDGDFRYFRFKDSIRPDMAEADLIISHAGAGTCLEVLGLKKPLVVVVNEKLHDNHQFELARQLYADQHAYYCTPQTLLDTLRRMNLSTLKPWTPGNTKLFVDWLDKYLEFSN